MFQDCYITKTVYWYVHRILLVNVCEWMFSPLVSLLQLDGLPTDWKIVICVPGEN